MKKRALPRETQSTCPSCGSKIEAILYDKEGDVWMAKTCREHGDFDLLFWKDVALYREAKRLSNDSGLPPCSSPCEWDFFDRITTTIAIDPTLRCDLQCPDCFSSASPFPREDPSVEEMLSWLPSHGSRGFRPNIAIVGGESTMRDDLPELIRGLLEKGYTPRLNTNGIGLLDPALRRKLKASGLKWVILQFDGFSPETSIRLRGRDLIEDKQRVIDLLAEDGFSIHLAVMLAKGVNDHEAGRIVEFALNQGGVKRLSFYPRSIVGRNVDPSDRLVMHMADVLQSLERGTGGRISRKDLVETKRLWHFLFRMTRHPVFRQRICIFPFVVMRAGNGYLPLNRLLKPGTLMKDPRLLGRLAGSLRALLQFDRGAYSEKILLVNIEKFYHRSAFDLEEARNCHHIYVNRTGFVPFCLYNSFYRD